MSEWEVVIGLEVHAQLKTKSKLFSREAAASGGDPNTHVNEVCAGFPGVLPVLNREAVAMAMKAGYALGCTVHLWSQFARKNYFYPDLPKGYQISQFKHPICTGGEVFFQLGDETRRCGITRIHIEEDAGKSIHRGGISLIDLNRAGVPLIEVVSEPDLRSADEASAYLKELRNILRYLNICDGNLEEGSFRCDANVSVHQAGTPLGTRAELKNINSFRFIRKAIDYEMARQIAILKAGGEVVQETRLFNSATGKTYSMRSKEDAHDYRYFPDPDLPPLVIDKEWAAEVKDSLPELPEAKRRRYIEVLGLNAYSAATLVSQLSIAIFFEAAYDAYQGDPDLLSKWILNELLRITGDPESGDTLALSVTPKAVADLVHMISQREITVKSAKTVFEKMLKTGRDPYAIADEEGLRSAFAPEKLTDILQGIIETSTVEVEQYQAGKTKLLDFFIGRAMKETRGKADPELTRNILLKLLERR